MKLRFRIG